MNIYLLSLSFCVIVSLAGCPEAAVSNVFNGVRSAVDQGAVGVVVCDWSGKGHLTHQPFSWPAFLIGAGLAWNSDTHWVIRHDNMRVVSAERAGSDVQCVEKFSFWKASK